MSSGRGKSNDAGTWRAHSLAKRAAGENTMKLMDGFDSNYRYILVAARRARQLQGGAPPVIETLSRKPCRIAQDEIKAGKVKWVIPEILNLPIADWQHPFSIDNCKSSTSNL